MKKISEADSRTYVSIGFLKKLDKTEPYVRELMLSLVDEVQSKIIVNKDEFDDLKDIVRELAEAQKKTELDLRDIRKHLGGLTMDVGYGIEDKIMPYICDFGKKEFDTDIRLVERRNLVYPDGNYDEINIYAEGMKQGKPVFIIGECKAQPGKKISISLLSYQRGQKK